MHGGFLWRAKACHSPTSTTRLGASLLAVVWLCFFPVAALAADEQIAPDPAILFGRTGRMTLAARQPLPEDRPVDRPTLRETMPATLPHPRKIMIVGDSFAVGLGLTMEQSLRHRKDVILSKRGKESSGLNSPRFYDWEKALGAFLSAERPEALVVMVGGNDAKNGQGTPTWSLDYQAKSKRFLDIASHYGIPVYWVGLPPMRETTFSQRAWIANEAMRAACAAAKDCHFITSWDLFADTSGKFCSQKPIDGRAKSLRGRDGVHCTLAGYKLLTDRVVAGVLPPSP